MKAFISYSHRDAAVLERLHAHLVNLRREGLIEAWYDREILAGSDFDGEIKRELEDAELFLMIVSPDFLNSNYCYDTEMARALERHAAGEARVVPIIVEVCEWQRTPLGKLKAVPRDGKAVSEWTNPNIAFLDVTQELRRILEAEAAGVKRTAPLAMSVAADPSPSARRYRVTREFDEIDRAEFRERSFDQIKAYFQSAIQELEGIEDLRGRFVDYSATSFGATVVNRARSRSTAHITVHRRSGSRGMGDIYWSFAENAEPNTSNGGYSVGNDEYELYLTEGSYGFRERKERMSPAEAAEALWTEFLEQAGVSYDN